MGGSRDSWRATKRCRGLLQRLVAGDAASSEKPRVTQPRGFPC
jgi:hypothetical protein